MALYVIGCIFTKPVPTSQVNLDVTPFLQLNSDLPPHSLISLSRLWLTTEPILTYLSCMILLTYSVTSVSILFFILTPVILWSSLASPRTFHHSLFLHVNVLCMWFPCAWLLPPLSFPYRSLWFIPWLISLLSPLLWLLRSSPTWYIIVKVPY